MVPLVKKKGTFGQEKGYLCVWKPLPRKALQTPKKVLEKLFKKVKEKKHLFSFLTDKQKSLPAKNKKRQAMKGNYE